VLAREMSFALGRLSRGKILVMGSMQYEGVRDSGIEEHLDFENVTRFGCPGLLEGGLPLG